jgi:predicted acetyltransferase
MLVRGAVETDIEFMVSAYASAFAFGRERTEGYIQDTGLANFYVVEADDVPAAVFALISTGHFFGGAAVPACNIAHVAISPEHRGAGLAATILDAALHEAANRGAAVASLFASTRPLYRKWGFELAGSEIVYEAETAELHKLKTPFNCRRVVQSEAISSISHIYSRLCSSENGILDRRSPHWNALMRSGDNNLSTFVFSDGRDDVGYTVLDTSDANCLVLRDWTALSGSAAKQILKFLGTFSTVYPRVRWHGAPHDMLVFNMPDKGWRLAHQEEFLMRVLSPAHALTSRGYDCAPATLGIEIVGEEKREKLHLSVENGSATCQDLNDGDVDISIGLAQFATLFSGFRSADFLKKAGWIEGDDRAIKLCNSIFAGPAPWVGEHF